MKKYKKSIINCIAICILLISLFLLISYNVKYNCDFFMISIGSLLTLLTAIFISYYLVQKNTDQRYQKEIYIQLLLDTQKLITNPETYTVNENTNIETITSNKRSLSNYIRIIDLYSKKFSLENEVVFIKDKFKEYDELIGNHISDIEYLRKSNRELRRPLGLINNKLYEMMLKLYD